MTVFSHPEFDQHHKVAFHHDPASGLQAIIALHNLNRGPALGGCRMWPYAEAEEALADVLRLARGMTYKSALAELPYGGGKAVIIGDPKQDKSESLFRAMGRFVHSLGGKYVTAEDVGIAMADVELIGKETPHVAGTRAGGAGDPSPATAYGVYRGIQAAVRHRLGRQDLTGVTVAVQGLGSVGRQLCRYLARDGAQLIVADIHEAAVRDVAATFQATPVAPEAVLAAQCDVFAPCALGGVIDDETIARLQAPIVAGSANNQLAEPRHGLALAARKVLYAPDYVINAGGIINISHEGPGYDRAKAFAHVARIGDTLGEIFARAGRQGTATSEAADRLAEDRFKKRAAAAAA
ncbi:MAG: Glu/Leu/Phe/Val dehydrogenase dimerization domain-containing protein [Pseudomonadota bacterium]